MADHEQEEKADAQGHHGLVANCRSVESLVAAIGKADRRGGHRFRVPWFCFPALTLGVAGSFVPWFICWRGGTRGVAARGPNSRILPGGLLFPQLPEPVEKVREDDRAQDNRADSEMMLYGVQNHEEILPEVIADEKESADPDGGAAVCEKREGTILQFRRPRDDRGEVTDTGDEVTGHQRPVADSIEPIVYPRDVIVLDAHQPAQARV